MTRSPRGDADQAGAGTLRLTVPAHMDFVAAVRGLIRSAGALGDLAVDDIEELQMAVDEAATLLLEVASGESPQLSTSVVVSRGRLRVVVSVPGASGVRIDTTGLAWVMLTGLDPEVEVGYLGEAVAITIERPRDHAPA